MRAKRVKKCLLILLIAAAVLLLAMYLLQRFWAHRKGDFVPDWPRVTLTEESDYETIYLQTGLGRPAVDALLARGDFQTILDIQDQFFAAPDTACTPLLGWFTREDRLADGYGPPLVDLQPGDIIVTLSTHTFGWRHGHAGLVINPDATLECVVLGTDSTLVNARHWRAYSGYIVLRLKDITPELQQEIVDYSLDKLYGVPYHLTSGFIGPKAPDPEDWQFGLHCSYLVWYAWNHFGYDLDSDGGRLASSYDLIHSDLLEVVQVYGMDPRPWLEEH